MGDLLAILGGWLVASVLFAAFLAFSINRLKRRGRAGRNRNP
ncbi:hypothetical protein [Xanthobacter sp. YC-JY1]|nr:hypothetical protein [Xanthobacter sp. YC-JY1]